MKIKERYANLIIVGIPYLCFLFWNIFGWKLNFQTPDDRILTEIASGRMTGEPEAHLIYIMYPLGLIIKLLYIIAPQINWYSNLLLFLQFGSVAIISVYTTKKTRSILGKILLNALVYGTIEGMWIYSLTTYTYTTVAAVVGSAMLTVYFLEEKYVKQVIGVTVLGFFCLNLRKDIFIMFLPLIIMGIIYNCLKNKEKKCYKIFIPVLCMLIICIVTDAVAYQSVEWKQYKKYNVLRTMFYDYYYDNLTDYDSNQELYEKLQVSRNDLNTIRQYDMQLQDYKLYGKIGQIISSHQDKKTFKKKIKSAIWCVLLKVIIEYDIVCIYSILMWSGLIAYCCLKRKRELVFWEIISAGIFVAFWGYLGYRHRILPRVTCSVLLPQCLYPQLIFVDLVNEQYGKNAKRLKVIAVSLAMLLIGYTGYYGAKNTIYLRASNEKLAQDSTYQDLRKYCNSHSDNFYFLDTYSVVDCVVTQEFFSNNEFDRFVSLGDWYGNSPIYQKKLDYLNIKSVHDEILENNNIYVIIGENMDISIVENMAQKQARLEVVDKIGKNGQLSVCKVVCEEG